MTQIDTSKWGKFRVGDLFETFHGERLKKSDRIEGSTPFVTAGSENQGVADYIVTEKKYSNAITIDMFGNCFYHDGTLFGDDNIYFLISNNISKHSKLFITTIINSTLKEKYSFSHQFRQKDLDTLIINLPSTSDNFPDWQYMEDYMKEITKLAAKRVEKLKEEKTKYKIDTKCWGEFRVGDLFEIKRSKNNINFERCNTGSTPLISAGNENNGIVGYIDKEDFEVFPANSITVNIFGKAFVQTKDFCASANVLIIRNEHLTKNIGLFIAAILSKKHSKYNYNDQINKDKLFNETISIPVTQNMTPDW